MLPKNKYWHLEGEELEEHLSSDCQLSIIEPMQTQEYLTEQEREWLAQFPADKPETPEYDDVIVVNVAVNEHVAKTLLFRQAEDYEIVGKPFKTARYWCLRVKYV